jgi:hypothetical protein
MPAETAAAAVGAIMAETACAIWALMALISMRHRAAKGRDARTLTRLRRAEVPEIACTIGPIRQDLRAGRPAERKPRRM